MCYEIEESVDQESFYLSVSLFALTALFIVAAFSYTLIQTREQPYALLSRYDVQSDEAVSQPV